MGERARSPGDAITHSTTPMQPRVLQHSPRSPVPSRSHSPSTLELDAPTRMDAEQSDIRAPAWRPAVFPTSRQYQKPGSVPPAIQELTASFVVSSPAQPDWERRLAAWSPPSPTTHPLTTSPLSRPGARSPQGGRTDGVDAVLDAASGRIAALMRQASEAAMDLEVTREELRYERRRRSAAETAASEAATLLGEAREEAAAARRAADDARAAMRASERRAAGAGFAGGAGAEDGARQLAAARLVCHSVSRGLARQCQALALERLDGRAASDADLQRVTAPPHPAPLAPPDGSPSRPVRRKMAELGVCDLLAIGALLEVLLPLAGSRDAAARPALERAREGVADARDCVSTAQRALALSAGVRRAESGDSNRTERSGGGSPLGEERGGAGALAARELERLQVAEMRGGSAAVQASLGALSSPRALRGGPERRHTAAVWKGRRVRRRSVGEGAGGGGGGGLW